ncbi:MAG TPA: RnfH family protein [Xylella sp.]
MLIAWPDRVHCCEITLQDGARVADVVAMAGLDGIEQAVSYAVFGVLVKSDHVLCDGDRLELLRPLLIDPKEARRRRAVPA